ncbi:nuclear receptor-binding factor 2-like [Toxorhynchites rutilus septentrionalis]|uniref:nuclear receptor-binding factor 2-like n=1 Tax=Toxorhynchites rutilus septentrionalis TaxID=329112 RepID=UPI00247AA255|nr:nuclear receptor-binding factor 2-like [Toxorhynchites rutilus septentrionalis]
MEKTPLNTAHFYARQADKLTKQKRFDDAIVSHRNAATNLEEAIRLIPKQTVTAVGIESLQLQLRHHLAQIKVLPIRKEIYLRELERLRREAEERERESRQEDSI